MVYVPEPMPAAPRPAMARPTMSAVLLGATPQTREPSSKTKMEERKVIFSGKYLYALPHADWKPPMVMKKAALYQATSSRPWNWVVILGIAVATMVRSRDTRKIPRTRAMMTTTSRNPEGYSVGVASRTGFSALSSSRAFSALSSSLVVVWTYSFPFSEAISGVDRACVELFASRRPGTDVCSVFSPLTRGGVEVMLAVCRQA